MLEMKHLCHLKIPFHVIKCCTQDFNKFIGKGGYGKVYKGILCWANHENQPVAVKRLDVTLGQGQEEFHNEIKMLSHCRHKNVVALVGFCDDNNEMIIVYEYASHGSLDRYLSQPTLLDELPWQRRLEICIGVSSALEYLHNHVATNQRILHRDIKSGNILLDDNRNAKLSDFGLSRIGPANHQQDTMVMTNAAGTPGYVDPKYIETRILMKESDVYSFGVVLFEVLCGRRASASNYNDEQQYLDHLARNCYENGELDKIIDHRIKKHVNPRVLSMVSDIAYQCLQLTREKRPTMDEVTQQLKEAIKIQTMPYNTQFGRRTGSTLGRATEGASSSGSTQPNDLESSTVSRGIAAPELLPMQRRRLAPCEVNSNGWNNSDVIRTARKINKKFLTRPWRTWSYIPMEVRSKMWECFQCHYTWDEALDAQMREIWERKCAKAYNNNLSSARTRAAKFSRQNGHPYDENDPNQDMNFLKPFPPDWISRVDWITMIDGWINDNEKVLSMEVEGEISKNTSGSILFGETSARLTIKKGDVSLSGLELFNHSYNKKQSTSDTSSLDTEDYLTSRCSQVADEFATCLTDRYRKDPRNYPHVDTQLWRDGVEGPKKGRLSRFGYHLDPNSILCCTPSQGGASYSSRQEIEDLRSQVQELKNRDESRGIEEEAHRVEEERRNKQYDEMCELVRRLNQNQ